MLEFPALLYPPATTITMQIPGRVFGKEIIVLEHYDIQRFKTFLLVDVLGAS